jgi:predicted metal-dependent hydrolase
MSEVNTRQSRLTLIGKFKTAIHGKTIVYTLKRSFKARLIWLDIKWQTGLTVTVPDAYNIGRLPEYLELNWEWIERNMAKYCDSSSVIYQNSLQKENSIPYLGKFLEVTRKDNSPSVTTVKLERNHLVVNLNSQAGGGLDHELEQWYRKQADALIRKKVQDISVQMGLVYNRVVIRGQRTRWGSCSCKKNLNFNWRIIMAPEPVIDYVIVHELSHLKLMNHSKKFWRLVEIYCPKWHEYREWLNVHTADLNTVLPLRIAGSSPPLPA